ncbi:DUF423 domain-containing protein [Micromonospora sp. NPDC092111]|uniref:DUF423 domain-containing protein n=1 Tax=Micromonospora sp. NPDC092111 TaxID=3364289 RepID=UPI003818A9A1
MTTGVRRPARDTARPHPPRWPSPPVLLALLVGVAAVGWRLALLLADTPRTNSDEATMGLAALHIARGDAFPVFFYGQAYMGTLEAYLAAPLVALTGPSVLALRLPLLALYALLLPLGWRLTRRLGGDRWFALLVVTVLALGSDRVVKNQLIAGGGYPELNPIGLALALLTVHLATGRRAVRDGVRPAPDGTGALPGGRRWRFAGWGLLAGLTVWVDPLLLPYLLALGVVLVGATGRELRGRAGFLLAGGLLLGAAPLLGHSVGPGRSPVAAALAASGGDAAAGWADRLSGGLLLGPSLGMGLCGPGGCAPWQLWWSVALPVLLALAGWSAWRTLRPGAGDPQPSDPGGPARAGAAVRLALVAGAVGTLLAYTVSSAAGRTPVESSRYLSCLAVSLPALLWPLWRAARDTAPRAARVDAPDGGAPGRAGVDSGAPRQRVGRVAAVGVLAALVGTAVVATAGTVGTVPGNRAEAQRHRTLVDALRARDVRHVYGEYWTCNRLTFAAREEIVCAVLDDRLRPGFDRVPAYRRAVAGATDPGYVAPVGSPLAARLDRSPPPGYAPVTVSGWRIWLAGH